MKKYFVLLFIFFLTKSVFAAEKEVIIFSQPCHFCELMKKDLDGSIIADNPDIKFTILDIREEDNIQKLRELAAEHNLKGSIGTPLLFIGKNYMMGWGPNAAEQLQKYIDEFKQDKNSPNSVVFKK